MKFKSILVIDDSFFDRLIAQEVIKQSIMTDEIITIDSGTEGLEYLISKAETPALLPEIIFLDIKMPVMDGFEFLEKYDALPLIIKENCKIYMLSSSVDTKDIDKAHHSKYVVDFIEKPLSKDKLISLSQQYCDERKN